MSPRTVQESHRRPRTATRHRGGLRLAVLVPMLLVLSACADTATGTTSSSVAGTGTPSATATNSGIATISGGVTTYVPADAPGEAASPDPNYDYGFVVQITPNGFHPHWLVSGCCRAVTWKNLTSKPESVAFDHQQVDSGPIAPGGAFTWTPAHPESITYHSGLDPSLTGALQVQQEFNS